MCSPVRNRGEPMCSPVQNRGEPMCSPDAESGRANVLALVVWWLRGTIYRAPNHPRKISAIGAHNEA